MRPPRKLGWRGKAILVCISLLFAALVFLPLAEMFFRQHLLNDYEQHLQTHNTQTNRIYEMVGGDLEYRLTPGFVTNEAYAIGWEMTEVAGDPWTFAVSEGGYRRNGPQNNSQSAGPAVLFLGDERTFGMKVNDSETFVALTEKRLRNSTNRLNLRCLNFGTPTHNISQQALLLPELISEHSPVAVVLNVAMDDAFPIWFGRTPPDVTFSETRSWFWRQTADTIAELRGVASSTGAGSTSRRNPVEAFRGRREWRNAIEEIAAQCERVGAKLVVVMHPEEQGLAGDVYAYRPAHEECKSQVEEVGAQFVDLLPALRDFRRRDVESPNDTLRLRSRSWNSVVAQELAAALSNAGVGE